MLYVIYIIVLTGKGMGEVQCGFFRVLLSILFYFQVSSLVEGWGSCFHLDRLDVILR